MTSKTKIILYSLAFFLIFLGFSGNANAAQIGNTIDWAWSGQLGWIHFNGSAATPDYGVTTTDGTGLTGYAWSEKGGYIKFSGTCSQAGGCPGGGNTYQVTASGTCAVGRECLSGWAWGAGIGWIHFAASGSNYANNSNTTYGVYIDSQGFFRGYAWNDQFGWIHFGGACTGGVGTCLNGEATYAVHEGPKNVYYSVGQSVSNLMTGSPTMNLTSGVATFSVAQTGNIGVGDRVTYNTSSVAYIASKTDSTGTDWQLVTATGGTPADVSVATVNSITHEYTSLAAAIAGATDVNHLNNTDLTVANVVLNIPCYYDSGSDTTAVTVSGYTTSAADYIKIYTPSNTTTYPAEANNSQRAMGKWDATKYNLQAGASSSSLLNILVPDVKIDGLQLYQSVGYYSSVVGLNSSGVVNLSVSNSIIRAFSGNTGNYGIIIEGGSTGSVYNIYNNIVYGASYDSGCNGLMVENSSVFLYNNTFYGNYTGIYGYSGTLIAKNNIVYNNTTDYSGSFDSSSTNNLSKDATAPGSNAEINRTVQFANAGANDFHLSLADTAALGHGANLSVDTNFAFDTDIDGQTRPTIWDIGADQSATAIYYSVGQNTNDHSSGGNVSISSGEATFDTPQTATNLGVGDVLTAGGNAYYISKKIDTSHWDVITALGATPADLSSTSVTSITHAFASLEGAVDASTASGAFDSSHLNTKDLVANNYQLNIPCYYDTGADTTAVTISGWTTGASNYIRIYTPKSLTTEANFSQRATGKWDNSKYSISANANVIYVQIENVHVDGLQVELNPTSDDGYLGIGVNSQSYIIDGFEASNNIVKQTTQKVDAYGVICYTGASTCKIWNNIVYGFSLGSAGRGSILVGGSSSTVAYVYNNTTYGNYIGIQELAGGEIFLNNNLSYNNGTDYDGSFDPSSTNNLSKDATAPAYGTYYRNATVTFVDATNDDFHLASTDTGAIGNGANLISDTYLPFSTDIDGQTRPATGAWDIGADESTSRVYYSVGQSASNLMTGAPTMTMVSGAAVLSVAQTGNIGVGDRVTYNTSQIAYIASKTDSSGTKWNLVTALGATPADVTTAVTVNSITHEYTSLAAAIAGASGANHINNLDLTAANVVLNIPCYYDSGPDTTAVNVSGFTTSATNYIKIYTPHITTTYPAEANFSQRAMGKWDNGKYSLEVSGPWKNAIDNNVIYTQVVGLQISLANAAGFVGDIRDDAGGLMASFNLITGDDTGYGIISGTYIYNNIIYNFPNNYGIYITSGYVYNNTVYNAGIAYAWSGGNGTFLENNIAQDTVTGYSNNPPGANNLSDHADAPGSNPQNSKTVQFADAAKSDFHLSPNDSVARGAGTNLSADSNLAFNTDIDGQTRPATGAWDIGADQSATAIYYSVGQNTSDHKTGTPTVTIAGNAVTFSTGQTATNMGVGDKITYTVSLTNYSCYITSKTSTDGTGWMCETATGGTPTAAPGGSAVVSITHAFSSLNAAVSGASGASYLNTSDLYTNNYQLNFPCYYDSGPDMTTVTVGGGYTTAEPNYIRVYTPYNTITEVNQSQRAMGKWDNSKYNASGYINLGTNYVWIDGLQIVNYSSGGYPSAIEANGTATLGLRVSNSIIFMDTSGTASGTGIKSGASMTVWNNVIYMANTTSAGMYFSYGKFYIYNNTVYGGSDGISGANLGEVMYAKNNLFYGNNLDYHGAFDSSSTNNLSKDATAPGSNPINSATVNFANATANDFHLSPTDTAALGHGANLSADSNLTFNTDINGNSRGSFWSIGADNGPVATINAPHATNTSASTGLDSGLVGYWSFDGPTISGTTVKDLSGQNNNGTNSGATPTIGARGQALSFDGTSSGVATGNIYPTGSGVSYAFWMKTPQTTNAMPVMGWGYDQCWVSNVGSHKINCTNDGGGYDGVTSSISVDDNKWHFIVFASAGGSNGTVTLYVDGQNQGSNTETLGISNDFAIKWGSVGFDSRHYAGALDEGRVYNRVLSAAEVNDLYHLGGQTVGAPQAATGPTSGLVGHWTFDGPTISGTTIADTSGSGNNGTNNGATPVMGKLGQAMSFDGTDDYAWINNSSALDFGSGDFSVGMWVNKKANSSGWSNTFGVNKWNTGESPGTNEWGLNLTNAGNDNTFSFNIEDGATTYSVADTTIFLLNKWYHVEGVKSGSYLYIYVDGVLKNSNNIGSHSVNNVGDAIQIARNGGGSIHYTKADFDDVRVYNRALSAQEVGDLYQAGSVTMK